MQQLEMPVQNVHSQSDVREAKLFRNNKSQAVRIPADFELPGERVRIHRDGDRLIIEPMPGKDLLAVLASLQPLAPEDQFPDIDETLLHIDETLLPARDVDL